MFMTFLVRIFDKRLHALATTMATINVVCPKCGITKKSGKMSCCGRGGSWFGNCGSAGNTKLDHTWYEGLQACKARAHSKIDIIEQQNGNEHQKNESSTGAGDAKFKSVITAANPLAFASAPMLHTRSIVAPAHTLANASAVYSKLITSAVTTVISTSVDMSTADKSITTSERTSYASASKLITVLAHTPVNSEGYKQVSGVAIYIGLLLTVALFKR